MKKALMCILFNLLGLGVVVGATFMAANGVALFWVVLVSVVAVCLLISPYKPTLMFGLCLTMLFGGLIVAGVCWFGFDGTSAAGPIPISLSLAGSGAICVLLPFGIGAIMEAVCGKDNVELSMTVAQALIPLGGVVLVGLLAYFVLYPYAAYQVGDYKVYIEMRNIKEFAIPDGTTKIEVYAFSGFDTIESFIIPDSVTEIDHSAFYHCDELKSINIPESVKSIGWNAFRDCGNLESVTIDGDIPEIGLYVFLNCYKLKSITIPASVTHINDEAFLHCRSLTDIYYSGTTEQWKNISKSYKWDSSFDDYTVHCTDGDIQ